MAFGVRGELAVGAADGSREQPGERIASVVGILLAESRWEGTATDLEATLAESEAILVGQEAAYPV